MMKNVKSEELIICEMKEKENGKKTELEQSEKLKKL